MAPSIAGGAKRLFFGSSSRSNYAWSMIFCENRYPLFGIMLWSEMPFLRIVISLQVML
jgi:hypothetical protein